MVKIEIYQGDVRQSLATLPDNSIHCVITSPPYWGLRDYGLEPLVWGGREDCEHEWGEYIIPGLSGGTNQGGKTDNPTGCTYRPVPEGKAAFCRHCSAWRGSLGLEPTISLYLEHLVEIFREVKRVLRPDGVLFLNLGDSYVANRGNTQEKPGYDNKSAHGGANLAIVKHRKDVDGLKPKDLCGIPWRVAFALQADGWWLRSEITWCKKAPMPESCADRPTSATEKIFMLTKSASYFYDAEAVKEKSTGQTGKAANFARETKDHLIPNQSRKQHRLDRKPTEDNGTRNLRNFWILGPSSFPGEYCKACQTYYPQGWRGMKRRKDEEGKTAEAICPKCDSWEDWVGHFATFGPELVQRCLQAGTSERGCCPGCKAPWKRVVEKKPMEINRSLNHPPELRTRTSGTMIKPPESQTIGWQPTCKCNLPETQPCTILDPFGGSGTTALVAGKMGLNAVICELKPEYVEMARQRLAKELGMLANISVKGYEK